MRQVRLRLSSWSPTNLMTLRQWGFKPRAQRMMTRHMMTQNAANDSGSDCSRPGSAAESVVPRELGAAHCLFAHVPIPRPGVVMKLRSHHHHMIHISYPNGRSQELCDAFGIPIHFGTKRDAMIHIEKLFSAVFRNQFEVDAYTTEGVTVA